MRVILLLVFVIPLELWAQPNQRPINAPPPDILNTVSLDQRLNAPLPLDLEFVNEEGKTVHLREYFGKKPVILSLVYYECPMLCNQILNGMVTTFKDLSFTIGKEFDVLTISIDPGETPALAVDKKKTYLAEYQRNGAESGWHFLVGKESNIKQVADAVGYTYLYDERTDQYAHPSGIMVITPEGKVSHYLYGIDYSVRDLRFALIDASKGKIGSPVDKVLLLCYNYDPMTGKYGVVVMNLLRGGFILVTLFLVGMFFISYRRDKKMKLALQTGSLQKFGQEVRN